MNRIKQNNEWFFLVDDEDKEYAIWTHEFGMTPKEYKNFKGLKKENLRDHMNDLELIFNILCESLTT